MRSSPTVYLLPAEWFAPTLVAVVVATRSREHPCTCVG
jgi:hypothetical protein